MRFWDSISGAELERAFLREEPLSDLLHEDQAIYLWRRNLTAPSHVIHDAGSMVDWLMECLSTPAAEVPAMDIAHFLHLKGISVGGGSLTDVKRSTLKELLEPVQGRQWLSGLLESLSAFAPPLYVGETDNLARRARQHLREETDFAKILLAKLKLSWVNLDLWYTPIPGALSGSGTSGKAYRTLIEMLTAHLVIAGCTSRPG